MRSEASNRCAALSIDLADRGIRTEGRKDHKGLGSIFSPCRIIGESYPECGGQKVRRTVLSKPKPFSCCSGIIDS
jgi:hypothetical protein